MAVACATATCAFVCGKGWNSCLPFDLLCRHMNSGTSAATVIVPTAEAFASASERTVFASASVRAAFASASERAALQYFYCEGLIQTHNKPMYHF